MEISRGVLSKVKKGVYEGNDLNGCVLSIVSIGKWSSTKGYVIGLSDDCEVFDGVFAETLNEWVKENLKVNDTIKIHDGIVGSIKTGIRRKLIVFVTKAEKIKENVVKIYFFML
jgi:hypothetical protein